MRHVLYFSLFLSVMATSCSLQKKIGREARKDLIEAEGLQTAQVGMYIYEPAANKTWYDYQANHYFVPASNTKIATCYAAMHFLGDSIPALQYQPVPGGLLLRGTGDPSFLLPEFRDQPIFDFLKKAVAKQSLYVDGSNWQEEGWGSGWSWNDYMDYYMAERSPLPVYGNVIEWTTEKDALRAMPSFFNDQVHLASTYFPDSSRLLRNLDNNSLTVLSGTEKITKTSMPYRTMGYLTAASLLEDTLQLSRPVQIRYDLATNSHWTTLYSRPVDSILSPMMHRSDNFFAEQSLLMVSQQLLGKMNDRAIIDTLLKSLYAELPQSPRWVDGSGLSRYNLFSPRDFAWILQKIKEEQGMERIRTVFPTGGEGTIRQYYKADSGYIYVKTGTLSNVVALSGYLETKKKHQLIFSFLVNNHTESPAVVRESFERMLTYIRNHY